MARHLAASLREGDFELDRAASYGFDLYTLRSVATAKNLWANPLDGEQQEALRHPHSSLAARAMLTAPSGEAGQASLAVLCRPAEIDAALALARSALLTWTDDIVILVDGTGADEHRGAVRLCFRPLDGDFAAQRNRAQDLARHAWVLQLDADETLGPRLSESLPWLIGSLDDGVVSVGLPRANLVDGRKADLYPDTQYRLNRREVRYEGSVHERPVRPWQQSLLALCGDIHHHLTREHVESRSRRYEAMLPGGGRLFEEGELLAPYSASIALR